MTETETASKHQISGTMNNLRESHTFKKWISLGGMFLILCPQGIVWYWGDLNVYSSSYLITYVESSGRIGPWLMNSYEFGTVFGMFGSPFLSNIIGKKPTTFLGTSIFTAGFVVSYFTIKKSALAMNLITGFFSGFGISISVGITIAYTVKWANGDFGVLHCIVQGGLSAGAIGMQQLITLYINPDNYSPNVALGPSKYFGQQDVLDKVPSMFLVLAACVACCFVVGIAVVRENSNESQQPCETNLATYGTTEQAIPYDESMPGNDIGSSVQKVHRKSKDLSPRKTLVNSTMHLLWVFALLGCSTYAIVTTYYKTYGQIYIADDHFLTNISTIILVMISVSRIGWGLLLDRGGLKATFIVFFSCSALASLLFYFSPLVSEWLYVLATIIFACIGNAVYVILAYASVELFGEKYCVYNLAIVLLPCSVLILLGTPGVEYVVEHYGWFALYASCSCWNMIGLIIAVLCDLPKE